MSLPSLRCAGLAGPLLAADGNAFAYRNNSGLVFRLGMASPTGGAA